MEAWIKDCDVNRRKCGHVDSSGECEKKHSRYFHGLSHSTVYHIAHSPTAPCRWVSLTHHAPSSADLPHQDNLIYDDGSSISLITHGLATALNLPYFERWETVTFASHQLETSNYALKVTRNDGKTKIIRCLGLDHITDDVLSSISMLLMTSFPWSLMISGKVE